MTKGSVSELDFLTRHEAAHAAVAFPCGLRLAPIHLDPANDSGGMTLEEPPPIRDVLIALAGRRAELVLDPPSSDWRIASFQDEVRVRNILGARLLRRAEHPDERLEHLIKRMRRPLARRCWFMVQERWPAIQWLAAVLASLACDNRLVELCGEKAEKVLTGEEG
jgi:hypothetical protein